LDIEVLSSLIACIYLHIAENANLTPELPDHFVDRGLIDAIQRGIHRDLVQGICYLSK
jgi:hypothetical protein